MHENSYWNHYIYKYTFERNLSRVIVALALIIIPTLFFIPLVNSSQNFDLARLIFSFLSFAILYEFLESTIRLKNASKAMLEIDNEISRNETLNEENLLNIFSQYVHLTRTVPSIPNKLYEKRSEEHTSELQSHSFISYAVFCLKKKKEKQTKKEKKTNTKWIIHMSANTSQHILY